MRIDGPQITSSLSLNGTTITDLNVFVTTASLNGITGSYATTGSNLFKGTQTISGSLLPAVNNAYDLGSVTHQFRDLYLSSASLYIDGTKVLGSTAQELTITTDTGQSFKILEAGADTITLQSVDGNVTLTSSGQGDIVLDPTTGIIGLKGTVSVYTGNKITSSDGNSIQFGNGIAVTGSIVSTVTPLVSGSAQISYTGLSNTPSGIVSGSSQITYTGITNIPSGIVSGSSQIIYSGLTGVPSGIISGSSQLTSSYDSRYVLSGSITQTTWDNIANKPVGITSGSSQIDITGTTGYSTFSSSISNSINTLSGSIATTTLGTKNRVDSIEAKTGSYATTGSNIFIGNQTITGSGTVTGDLTVQGSLIAQQFIISSSVTYLTTSFSSGSTKFGDTIDDTHNFTGSVNITGSLNISGSIVSTTTPLVSGSNQISYTGITNIPSGIISSSIQVNGASINGNMLTIGTTGISLGSTQTSLGGLVSVTSTTFTGALTGNASTATILETARTINGTSFDGSANITIPNLVSGSSQIVYSGLTGIPSGIISGSSQLPSGVVSGSAQTIANLPSGTVSGSSQVLNGTGIFSGSAQLPSGIVSGSVQIIDLGFATTSSVITASAVRKVDTFTASANQSTFTASQGYSVGLMDVYVNGSKLAAADYVATNGTTVVLNVASEGGETVELYAYFQALNSNNALRTVTIRTATASQTLFTGITYTQGLIEVYYNGSRLSESEYTATNGTSVTLSTAANVGDILDFIAYNYTVGAFVGLSGTGTANYLPKYASTSSLTNSSIIDNSGAVTINGTLVVTGTTLVSGSSQILNGTTIHSGSFFNGISVVSGSGQISYAGITNIPSGIVSGSAQIPSLLPSGVVSGSAQTIANLPSGTVSGSVQVDVMSTTNIARLATTGSNTFQGNQTVNGSLVVTGSLTAQQFIVSSSVTYLTESFASGSHKFGDSSDDYHDFTGSLKVSGSITTNNGGLFANMSTTNTPALTINRNSTGYNGILKFQTGASDTWILGNRNTNDETFRLYNYNMASDALTFSNSGSTTFSYASTFSNNVTLTNSVFPVLTVQGTVSSPHIGSTWSVSANQDGTGRTIIATAGQGRAMYFENNGDIAIPNNTLSVGGSVSVGGHLTGNGVNPGGLGGSRYVIDWSGGYSRFFSYGANTSTNGGIVFNTQRSNGTNSIDVLSIAPSGVSTFSSTTAALNPVIILSPPSAGYVNLQLQSNSSGNTSYGGLNVVSSTGKAGYLTCGDNSFASGNYFAQASYVTLAGTTGAAMKFRVDASDTKGINITLGGQTNLIHDTTNLDVIYAVNSSASPYGMNITFASAAPNNTTNNFIYLADSSGLKCRITSNGSIYNSTGTYGTVSSDIRLKENVINATSKLDDIMKLRVVNFNLIDDVDKKKNIGFIAQEFKEVFPSLTYIVDTRKYDEDGNLISGLEDSLGLNVGMEFAILTKSIQEQQQIISDLKDRITILENK